MPGSLVFKCLLVLGPSGDQQQLSGYDQNAILYDALTA